MSRSPPAWPRGTAAANRPSRPTACGSWTACARWHPISGAPLSPALITSLREAAGMTQEELGKRIGRDKLTVSRWECGSVRPSKEALARLARLFRKLKASGVLLPG